MKRDPNPSGNTGILVLEDGHEFPGVFMGAPASMESIQRLSQKDFGYGEVVFNTSMTGYQEILTDPSYYGQIICMTAPHIGNTGINAEDSESRKAWCSGLIIHEAEADGSAHWRSQSTLHDYLLAQQIPALHQVDTRALTRHLRSKGVIRGIILPEGEKSHAQRLLSELPPFEGRDMIQKVSTKAPYHWSSQGNSQGNSENQSQSSVSAARKPTATYRPTYRVIAIDLGVKWNLLRSLEEAGCEIEVVPAATSTEEILSKNPHGVFLSNGPGDPTATPYVIKTVKELLGRIPLFGVCMGHQILGLAVGGKTYKLKFGHRGGNQPVLDHTTGRIEISSHNHGYSIDAASLPSFVQVTHMNLNDKTLEGISIPEKHAFSVQYHPEACPGPHDSVALFQQFTQMMKDHVSKIS